MLYTIMCPKYHRIEVEFRARAKWTMHVKCGMFWTVIICAPYWIIAVFGAFHSYTCMCLANTHQALIFTIHNRTSQVPPVTSITISDTRHFSFFPPWKPAPKITSMDICLSCLPES